MSKFIIGIDRSQIPLFASSMEQAIAKENEVRLIDLFVDRLKLADFGFKCNFVENGRAAYHPEDLLKLFIYGYLNRMRSSRVLEKECIRNMELIWLMKSFYYIMTKKTIKHASADMGLIFTAYNLKRIFKLVDLNMLKKYLKRTAFFYRLNKTDFKAFSEFKILNIIWCLLFKRRNYCPGNGSYLLQN